MAVGLTACAVPTPPGDLAELKKIAASCPEGREVAGRAAIDVSGDRLEVAADDGRLAPVRALAERVAVCGGTFRADIFGGSAGAVSAVYDGELHAQGATENARLKRVPKMVDAVMDTVKANLPKAAATLSRDGKDVVSQLGLAAEFGRQLDPVGTRYVLDLVITTDGAQTVAPSLTDSSLTVARAEQLAQQVTPVDLTGATVRMTDIGKAPGQSFPSDYVNALKAFFRLLCEATKAAACFIVTDAAVR
ncbi:hypothetical protein [Nocardia arizonensis]|uniref:hypothetical protein n=1 Tax=Nocardia arizonensis TaxID=1141647 RepID=UPI0019520F2D|nr:hypothetical protein [Nocardia arizonensis]